MAEQIALIEVPIRDITDATTVRLVEEVARLDVLGNMCQLMTTGRHWEFWVGKRRFEINLQDLADTAAAAIGAHLKGEIRARVLSARGAADQEPEGDGFVTLHPVLRQ
jgi:hypothetical protein